jgi:hypothetical protein
VPSTSWSKRRVQRSASSLECICCKEGEFGGFVKRRDSPLAERRCSPSCTAQWEVRASRDGSAKRHHANVHGHGQGVEGARLLPVRVL